MLKKKVQNRFHTIALVVPMSVVGKGNITVGHFGERSGDLIPKLNKRIIRNLPL